MTSFNVFFALIDISESLLMLNRSLFARISRVVVVDPAIRPANHLPELGDRSSCGRYATRDCLGDLGEAWLVGLYSCGGEFATQFGIYLLVLGIAALVSGYARWAAPLPFVGMFVANAAGKHGGSIVLGAMWVLLGVVISRTE
jgi:hypothetical protein